MSQDLLSAFRPLLERMQGFVQNEELLNSVLREVGVALIALTEKPVPREETVAPVATEAVVEPAPPVETPAPVVTTVSEISLPVSEPSPARFMEPHDEPVGVTLPVQPTPGWRPVSVSDEDLPLIEARCRLKADGARWAIERQQLLKERANFYTEVDPRDRDIIARAKTVPDCFLWMCHRDAPIPSDPSLYQDLAGCFEAMADMAALFARFTNTSRERRLVEDALVLGAEVQSALRVAVAKIGSNPDWDQIKMYVWVKTTGLARMFWIERFMRQDDPADPTAWPQLRERIKELGEKLHNIKDRDRRQGKLVSKIRYHVKRIQSDIEADHIPDWQTIVSAVTELIQEGLPPSNSEIRDILLPFIDDLPDMELPKAFLLFLREMDRFIALRPAKVEEPTRASPAPEVTRAANLLRGRALVLIGGERRPSAADALTAAFGLSELIWLEGREHQSHFLFEPDIARPDVVAVLLAIRWSSHGFGEVKAFCDANGKPLVRLPTGYSPNQVAFQILSQIGDRLTGKS